jgi:hypothetical protein
VIAPRTDASADADADAIPARDTELATRRSGQAVGAVKTKAISDASAGRRQGSLMLLVW